MSLYVEFRKPETLKDFLTRFFGGPEGSNRGFGVATYEDEQCTKMQCGAGRNRSLNDLYDCVTTYFPDVTLKDIVKELASLIVDGSKLVPVYCWVIRKHVISFGGRVYGRVELAERTGEFTWNEYEDVLQEAGINVVPQ